MLRYIDDKLASITVFGPHYIALPALKLQCAMHNAFPRTFPKPKPTAIEHAFNITNLLTCAQFDLGLTLPSDEERIEILVQIAKWLGKDIRA